MRLYKTENGPVLEERGEYYQLPDTDWDVLVNRGDHETVITSMTRRATLLSDFSAETEALAPIGRQEVWAAGVTYFRSRTARMEESKSTGGGDFYDRVYHADRPELFFKSAPHRVVGDGGTVAIRSDAKGSVPETYLAALLSPAGTGLG